MRKSFLLWPFLLTSCGMLEPDFTLPKLATAPTTLAAPALPFVSPTLAGSWVVVDPDKAQPVTGLWYSLLNLPELDALISKAKADNPTLQAMAARVKLARAEADVVFAAQMPTVTGNVNASRGRSAPSQARRAAGTAMPTTTTYGTDLTAVMDLDIFGRLGLTTKAAELLAEGAESLAEDVTLTLEGDVARTYVALLAATETEAAWADALRAAEERQAILTARYNVGELNVVDWQTGSANLLTLRASALTATTQHHQVENALATLLGGTGVPVVTSTSLAVLAQPLPVVPDGISSTVLLNRPDMRVAAKQLAAANASIGAARAAFFPSLSLTARGGYASEDLGDVFEWGNRTWAMTPLMTIPIFQWSALQKNLNRRWAQYEEQVALYRGKALTAFQQVSDGLVMTQAAQAQASGARQALADTRRAVAAVNARYTVGDVGKFEQLTARMAEAQARIAAAQAGSANYGALIRLVQALGGRW